MKLEEIMACPRTLYVVSSLVRIFPDKPKPEYKALRESISRLGLLDPILMWRGMVVDGYHRLRPAWNWKSNRGSMSSLTIRTLWKSWWTG